MALRRSRTRAPLLTASLLSLFLAPGVSAQNSADVAPANAHARPYGTGWQCDFGYRQTSGLCAAIELPANAHVAGFSLGLGWECDRGYRHSGALCAKVDVPANAYSTDSSRGRRGWECD